MELKRATLDVKVTKYPCSEVVVDQKEMIDQSSLNNSNLASSFLNKSQLKNSPEFMKIMPLLCEFLLNLFSPDEILQFADE